MPLIGCQDPGGTVYGSFSLTGVFVATLQGGEYAEFPDAGPASGGVVCDNPGVLAQENTDFVLPLIGDYDVSFAFNVPEQPSQWIVELEDTGGAVEHPETAAGGATATASVAQRVLISTTEVDTILRIKLVSNVADTQLATEQSGSGASTATLVIRYIGPTPAP